MTHLLSGAEREARTRQAVVRIALALRGLPPDRFTGGFASGPSGVALFFALLHGVLPERGFDADACEWAGEAALQLDGVAGTGWIDGFPGAAWALHESSQSLPGALPAVAFEEHDQRLIEQIDAGAIPDAFYDTLYGWAGVLLHAAQRPHDAMAREIAASAWQRLAASSRRDGRGAYWLELPEQFAPAPLLESASPELRQSLGGALRRHPQGRCNLGVAHGVAGVIGCLSAAVLARCVPDDARTLLSDACDWLLAQRREVTCRSAFGSFEGDDEESRAAWCYGDPGIALQLLHAARALQRPDLARAGHGIALHATRRQAAEGHVLDACLCHGSAGLSRLFARAAQATGDAALAQASLAWLDETLAMQLPPESDAAYAFGGLGGMQASVSVLEGSVGVGLALLAFLDPEAASWDRAMLMSA